MEGLLQTLSNPKPRYLTGQSHRCRHRISIIKLVRAREEYRSAQIFKRIRKSKKCKLEFPFYVEMTLANIFDKFDPCHYKFIVLKNITNIHLYVTNRLQYFQNCMTSFVCITCFESFFSIVFLDGQKYTICTWDPPISSIFVLHPPSLLSSPSLHLSPWLLYSQGYRWLEEAASMGHGYAARTVRG